MKTPRLWVKEITSVGAVEEGDNPEAQIVFWKARGPDGHEVATSTPESVERRVAERRTRNRRQGPDRRNRITELVTKAVNEYRKATTMPKSTETTLTERCVETVQKAAHEIMLKDYGSRRGLTEAEVRAKIWRSDDGRALRQLMNSSEGKRPASEAISEIRKSKYADHFAHGLSVLAIGL